MSTEEERLSETKINKTGDHFTSNELDDKAYTSDSVALLGAKPEPKMLPMSPLAASATVVNLILATGPFR